MPFVVDVVVIIVLSFCCYCCYDIVEGADVEAKTTRETDGENGEPRGRPEMRNPSHGDRD